MELENKQNSNKILESHIHSTKNVRILYPNTQQTNLDII